MKIVDQFDAAKYGTYKEFLQLYAGDPNAVPIVPSVNLLGVAILGRQDENERKHIIMRLLSDGGNPNYVTRKNEDALILLFKRGAREWSSEGISWLVKALISAGLDILRRDAWGNDALMLSVRNTKQESYELLPSWKILLDAGADPTIAGPQDKTTLDWANEFSWRKDFLALSSKYGFVKE